MVCVGMGAHKNMASLSEEAQSEVKKKKIQDSVIKKSPY